MIDLRSDTVTRPTPAMRQAIAEAEVHDDVIDVDPTVDRLQRRTAELLGKEAALFMPSGSMTNQIAIRLHCDRGDEFLCEANCHVYNYEQAAFAQLSGVVARTVSGRGGVLQPEQLVGLIRPANDHMVRTRLVTLENTHNRAGGRIQPLETVRTICDWAHENGLKTHLDGARLWNAAVATGIDERTWASGFDSVSVCFSKGLGAPVGSCLAGSAEFIQRARRARKLFGGGMRQAGILAAGALHALDHHRDRLAEDHEHAQRLAAAIRGCPSLELNAAGVETNIVIFHVDRDWGTAAAFVEQLAAAGVQSAAFGPQSIRLVTHLDVDASDIDRACQAIGEVARSAAIGQPVKVDA
ncbi:MAG: GntG family PLP-dependent aldolase [Pirellulaceae bacterium]